MPGITQPNYADNGQSGSAYPTAIDAITQVMARIATAFNPHAVPAAAAAPVLTSSSGGTLGARTYYAKITLVTPAGEVAPSAESNLALSANTLLNVASPTFALGVTGWNVYVGTSSGNETKQNSSPIAIGTAWVEPTSGLIAGSALPAGMSQMKVIVDAGVIPASGALATEVAAQLTSAITAPTTNPRKDIVYIDATTGAVGVATGTEAASPSDPAIPAGKVAVGRINCTVGMTAIANSMIDDIRSLGLLGVSKLLGDIDALVFKGVIDCSANPNYPAGNAGDVYKVSVAGKIGGAAGPNVEVGDVLTCLTDGSAAGNHATVGANWNILQANIDGVLGASPVVHKNANYSVVQVDNGKTLVADAALDFTLPAISGLTLPFEVTVKLGAATGTNMGAVCSGTDKIVAGGAEIGTTKTNVRGCWMKLAADSTGKWQAIYDWGFESSEITISDLSAHSATHNLGAQPAKWWIRVRCKTAELGYSVGDESQTSQSDGGTGQVFPGWASTTQIGISTHNYGYMGLTYKTSGGMASITPGNWKFVFRAYL